MEITRLSHEELELIRENRERKKQMEEIYNKQKTHLIDKLTIDRNEFIKNIGNLNKLIEDDFYKIKNKKIYLGWGDEKQQIFTQKLINQPESEQITIEPYIYKERIVCVTKDIYFYRKDNGYRCSEYISNLQCRSYQLSTIVEKYFNYINQQKHLKETETIQNNQLSRAECKLKEIYPGCKINVKKEYKTYTVGNGKLEGYYVKTAKVETANGFVLKFSIGSNKIVFNSILNLNKAKLEDINNLIKLLEKDQDLKEHELTSILF